MGETAMAFKRAAAEKFASILFNMPNAH
jgi:hypothetical protein